MINEFYTKISKTDNGWVRPSEWLPIPSITTGEEVIYLLLEVCENNSNFTAFLVGGNYTVDWGDGTIENFTGGVQAQRNIMWSNVSPLSLTSKGCRQSLIKVTPQSGHNITYFSMQRINSDAGSGKGFNYIDLVINAPNINSSNLIIGSTTLLNVSFPSLQRVWIKEIGNIDTSSALFGSLFSLKSVPTFNTGTFTNFSNYFVSTNINQLPPLDYSNATSMIAFIGVSRIETPLDLNIPYVTNLQNFALNNNVIEQVTLNIPSCTVMISAFNGCRNLKMLDLTFTSGQLISGANIANFVTACTNLQTMYMRGCEFGFSVLNCNLNTTALNNMFTSLGTASGSQTITITGNPGASTCDTTIATGKGFTVVV